MAYPTLYIGKQTVQTYHPERGDNWQYQVSTYGPNGWLISHCHRNEIEQTKANDYRKALDLMKD